MGVGCSSAAAPPSKIVHVEGPSSQRMSDNPMLALRSSASSSESSGKPAANPVLQLSTVNPSKVENKRRQGATPDAKARAQSDATQLTEVEEERRLLDGDLKSVKLLDRLAALKLERLRNLDIFVIDNSVRESTVGQCRGHTVPDKFSVMDLVMSTGIRHQVIATFAEQHRVDDRFCRELAASPALQARYAGQTLYCFAEVTPPVQLVDGKPAKVRPSADLQPTVGMKRAAAYGIANIIFEADVMCERHAPVHFLPVLRSRLEWARAHCRPTTPGGMISALVNFRDLVPAWEAAPEATKLLLRAVATLRSEYAAEEGDGGGDPGATRLAVGAVLFEDPSGGVLPFAMAAAVARTQAVLQASGWATPHILVHVHNNFGLAEACIMESLASGATGSWCGISREGAATGHANSLTTLVNLARLGNRHVTAKFNFKKLREAAIAITVLTTGEAPHPNTELYGSRAMDEVFGGAMGASPSTGPGAPLSIDELMGVPRPTRITSFTTPAMFATKLSQEFGVPPDGPCGDLATNTAAHAARVKESGDPFGGWDPAVCTAMQVQLNRDLLAGRKEDYSSSPEQILSLYERAGGQPSESMVRVSLANSAAAQHPVIAAFRAECEQFLAETAGSADDSTQALDAARREMDAETFYNFFLGRFISSPESPTALAFVRLLDLDDDGSVSLDELLLRLQWAVVEHPREAATLEGAAHVIINKLLAPALSAALSKRRLRSMQIAVRMVGRKALRNSRRRQAPTPQQLAGSGRVVLTP